MWDIMIMRGYSLGIVGGSTDIMNEVHGGGAAYLEFLELM